MKETKRLRENRELRALCGLTVDTSVHSHSWDIIENGAGIPVSVICECGEAGNVVMR